MFICLTIESLLDAPDFSFPVILSTEFVLICFSHQFKLDRRNHVIPFTITWWLLRNLFFLFSGLIGVDLQERQAKPSKHGALEWCVSGGQHRTTHQGHGGCQDGQEELGCLPPVGMLCED
jgi:hypothetical protein